MIRSNQPETLMSQGQVRPRVSQATVRARAVRGLGAMAILQIVGAAINLLTLIILARLLVPRDFGFAAVAALVTGIVGIAGDFGLGPAVIQRKDRTEEALYTASTIRIVIAFILFAVTFVFAPYAAAFFSAAETTDAIRLVASLFLLNSAAFIPVTRLQKDLKFGVILRASTASALASAVTSISLAYAGFGFWSIIIASVVAAVVLLGAYWLQSPWKLRIVFDRSLATDLIRYGRHLFLMNLFVFFILNIDSAAIARSLGAVALGFYALAYKWANVPVNFLSKVAAQVMMPTYVLLRDSPERLRKGYFETILMINAASWPVYIGLLILADDFVEIVLGPVWLPIVLPMRILCVMGMLRGIAEPGVYTFMATGRSHLVSMTTGLHAGVFVVLLVPGLLYGGIVGVAASVAAAYAVNLVLVQHRVNRFLGVRWGELANSVRPLVGAGAGMALFLVGLHLILPTSLAGFFLTVSAGLAVYLALLRLLEKGMLSRYLRQILDAARGPT